MKTGIMSMQRIYNYGSWLQAYALKKMVESVGQDSVEFVDYRAKKPITAQGKGYSRYLSSCLKSNIAELIASNKFFLSLMPKRGLKFIYDFKRVYQPVLLGKGCRRKNYTPKLDNLIIGSDEVFNCLQSNPKVGYSSELFGKGSRAKNTISYAASFGNTTLEKIKFYQKDSEIAEWLNGFDEISVRDENSYQIVKALTGRSANLNLDPVLIYDFASEMQSCQDFDGIKEKYLLVYTYENRLKENEKENIKEYARARGLKIVGINGYYDFLDVMVSDSPLNILQWFKNSECVVTDTFHGTIFSVINHKKFATIIRKSQNGSYGNQEKLHDLLTRLSLTDRSMEAPNQIGDLLDGNVDYALTDEIILKEREKTYQYLNSALNKG